MLILSSRKPEHLRQNLAAADIRLSTDEVAETDRLSSELGLMVFVDHRKKEGGQRRYVVVFQVDCLAG